MFSKVIKFLIFLAVAVEIKGCIMPENPPPGWKISPHAWRKYRARQKQQIAQGRGCRPSSQTPRRFSHSDNRLPCEIVVKTTLRHKGTCIQLPNMNEPMCLSKYRRNNQIHTKLGRDSVHCRVGSYSNVQRPGGGRRINRNTSLLKRLIQKIKQGIPITNTMIPEGTNSCHLYEVVLVRYDGQCVILGKGNNSTYACESFDQRRSDIRNRACSVLRDQH